MFSRLFRCALVLSFVGLVAGCASTPKGPPPEVVRLQSDLERLHADQRIAPYAVEELRRADAAVDILVAEGRHLDRDAYEHQLYLADRMIGTAEAEGLARFAEDRSKALGSERERLFTEARTREADRARAAADAARASADASRAAAVAAQMRADEQQRAAEVARADADASRDALDSMRSELAELQAKQTERGVVVTLGDVLFEVDRAELKPGASRNLDKLVVALRDNRDTQIQIEGHTDATGSREHNLDLSSRRADSVRDYLVAQGIAPSRVMSRGMGPDYPVASNSSDAGRQQNRRVEIVIEKVVATR